MVDVLGWPVVGRLLRWRHARTALQLASFCVAAVLVAARPVRFPGRPGQPGDRRDLGALPRAAGRRAAGRGQPVLHGVPVRARARLRAAACTAPTRPLAAMAPHEVDRDRPLRRRAVRYELFDLWALPRGTALLVLAYFGAALSIDLVFSGATFCKYLCPIGQFNFVASTMSPLELRVREPERCRTCRTFDCIKGGERPAPDAVLSAGLRARALPALQGRQPRLHVLPGLRAGVPARQRRARGPCAGSRGAGSAAADRASASWHSAATSPRWRSCLRFGGLLNALAMVAPGLAIERWLARLMGSSSEAPCSGRLVCPRARRGAGRAHGRRGMGKPSPGGRTAGLPGSDGGSLCVGAGPAWLRGVAGPLRISSADRRADDCPRDAERRGRRARLDGARRTALAVGGHAAGPRCSPSRSASSCWERSDRLTLTGLVAERDHPDRAVVVAIPWFAVVTALAVAACWILSQPMDMRAIGVSG